MGLNSAFRKELDLYANVVKVRKDLVRVPNLYFGIQYTIQLGILTRRRRGCGSRRVGDTLERIPRSRVGSRVLRLWAIAAHALTGFTCAVF